METRPVEISEAACKTLLQRSKMGFTEYTLNPYVGCAFGCSFCYVPSLRKFRGQEWETWGEWAQAKINAPEVLRRELAKLPPDARILIGTATDAWQPIEKRYGITRAILEELARHSHPVCIITRSPLLLRDLPILQQIAANGGVHVGVSLSTFDDRARKVFEPRAPSVKGREHLLRALAAAEIPRSLFWAPLLPGVSDNAEAVAEYLRRAAELGVRRVMCDLLNYRETMGAGYAERLRAYYAACAAEGRSVTGRAALNRAALARVIRRHADRYGIACDPGFG
ncbi:MAG TPA: radical SAM protein [Chthonomonadaceae bacterium]|nr:radical SAM protein [Chthonomonadaceae bacterium]